MVSNVTHPCPCRKCPHLASLAGIDGRSKHLVFHLAQQLLEGHQGNFRSPHLVLGALRICSWTGGITNLFWTSAKSTESNSNCLVTWSTNQSEVCSIFIEANYPVWTSIWLGKFVGSDGTYRNTQSPTLNPGSLALQSNNFFCFCWASSTFLRAACHAVDRPVTSSAL